MPSFKPLPLHLAHPILSDLTLPPCQNSTLAATPAAFEFMLVFSQLSHDYGLGLENVISLGPACVDFESTIKA